MHNENCRDQGQCFDSADCKAYFGIRKICPDTDAINIENDTIINFLKLNYYTLVFTIYPLKGCPISPHEIPLELDQLFVDPSVALSVTKGVNSIAISGVLPVGTKLR